MARNMFDGGKAPSDSSIHIVHEKAIGMSEWSDERHTNAALILDTTRIANAAMFAILCSSNVFYMNVCQFARYT